MMRISSTSIARCTLPLWLVLGMFAACSSPEDGDGVASGGSTASGAASGSTGATGAGNGTGASAGTNGSGASGSGASGTGASGTGAGSGSGGTSAGGAGVGGAGASGTGGAAGVGGGMGSGGGGDEDASCAAEAYAAEALQLDMYIMLDQSGSMTTNLGAATCTTNADCGASGLCLSGQCKCATDAQCPISAFCSASTCTRTRWTAVKGALKTFFDSPQTTGIGVGMQYFPLPSGQECNVGAYATPDVAIAPLPGNSGALKSSLDARAPNGATPTRPAEQGAVQHAQSWKTTHPDRVVIVVLATDGEPNICTSTVANVAAAAAAGYTGSPSVPTYVIGVGNAVPNLNTIASAGGTGSAFIVNDANATQQFIDAMLQIKVSAVPCEYFIPEVGNGQSIDPDKVNMQWTPDGGQPVIIKKVDGAGQCAANGGGWYYDDPVNPTKIVACPETCDMIKANPKGVIQILYGCKTEHA